MPAHHYETNYGVHLDSRMLKMLDHFKNLEKEIEMRQLTRYGVKATFLQVEKKVKVENN